jgi:hypothetical protein
MSSSTLLTPSRLYYCRYRHYTDRHSDYSILSSGFVSVRTNGQKQSIDDGFDDDSERRSLHEKDDIAVSSLSSASNTTTSTSSTTYPSQSNNWLEDWALEGAVKIAQLNIHERTQRALLAEMAEDKIYELNEALERLIDEETGKILDLDQARDIAQQTRSLQEQYRALVTGGPSSMLQAMASLNENSSSSNSDGNNDGN